MNYSTIAATVPGQTRMKFTVPITHALVPGFNLLVFFARNDGEIVADFVEVKVECDLKEKVKEENLQISEWHVLLCYKGEYSLQQGISSARG